MRNKNPDKRIKYMREVFAPEDDVLRSVREELEKTPWPIQIGAEEGRFLQFLVNISRAKKIVEVGTLAGYSTLWLAKSLPEDGHIFTIEKNPQSAEISRKNFARSKYHKKISLIEGNAIDVLNSINDKAPFDMIFIDADKVSYPKYLDWAEKNIRAGGLIVGDNTFLFGTVYEEKIPKEADVSKAAHEAMKEFNRRLADPRKYLSFMLPSQEGMTIAMRLPD